MILVTGGAGFIGSNFILDWLSEEGEAVVNLDKLTYAGNPSNLAGIHNDSRYLHVKGDIGDHALVRKILAEHRPRAIIHFAAETHVDRSIHGPEEFIETNVVGSFRLLDEARGYWGTLSQDERSTFRFLHVSTDEVYGSLELDDPAFDEESAYAPNSPYSASKAASDHLVRAYFCTYGLPVIVTNCSNNYGPYQFPEKLIPLMLLNALNGESLPVYGEGKNVRDWLYVKDHCAAILAVLSRGRPGETYVIGGCAERCNLDVVHTICDILDRLRPGGMSRRELVTFVRDRPGHDLRYAMNPEKLRRECGWEPRESFETGIEKTVEWYLDNPDWIRDVTSGGYREWIKSHYGESKRR